MLAVKDAICFCKSKGSLVMKSTRAGCMASGNLPLSAPVERKMTPISQTVLSRGDYMYYMYLASTY